MRPDLQEGESLQVAPTRLKHQPAPFPQSSRPSSESFESVAHSAASSVICQRGTTLRHPAESDLSHKSAVMSLIEYGFGAWRMMSTTGFSKFASQDVPLCGYRIPSCRDEKAAELAKCLVCRLLPANSLNHTPKNWR